MMINSSDNMMAIYPDKFTLSLNRDTFVCINMDRKLGVLTIDEFVDKQKESLKIEVTEEDFLDDFVTGKVQQGYMMLEGEAEIKPDEELMVDFAEIENDVGVNNDDKDFQVEEEKFEDFISCEKFECPFELTPVLYDALREQVASLDLKFSIVDKSVIEVTGKQSSLVKFYSFINDFFCDAFSMISPAREEEHKFELIPYLAVYDDELENIIMKATALEIECVHEKKYFHVSGCAKDLENFKLFLGRIDSKYKGYLYPKYWDFSIVDEYSEITVDPSSEEFEEICKLFNDSFNNAEVTKLTRIQNLNLYNNYIETMCSRTEVGPNLPNLRKLLFHGTRTTKPSCIYKDSKIGFELEQGRQNCRFGKGIYFAANSFYSHGYAHMTGDGTYQMLLADVYTGVSYYKNSSSVFVSLTEEQDSLQSHDNIFVLYKNSQCYPLYLVDYSIRNIGVDPYFRINNLSSYYSSVRYSINPAGALAKKPDTSLTPDVLCRRRVQKEFDYISQDAWLGDNFFVEKVDKSGCIEWTISLIGFQGTPYEGGLFKISIVFPSNYPIQPPFVQFKTKIYHPSVDEKGIVCLGLLSKWSPTSEIRHVLLAISCIMHDPKIEEPLMPDIKGVFEKNRNEFTKTARSWTEKYAS